MDTRAELLSQSPKEVVNSHVYFTPRSGGGWQSYPEFPTAHEILALQKDLPQLPENPVDKKWESKEEYLNAQYRILRHEAVEGLRYSVRSFADASARREMVRDDEYTCIYTKVRVKEYLMSTLGPIARVSFSTESSLYIIQWQQSKRLQPGSIVALSPKDDKFRKICKIASIAQRPYHDGLDQDPPLVDLLWAYPEDAVFDPELEMVMIESRNGYFESARHALVGLQHAAGTNSPLDKYLTGTHTRDTVPQFVKANPFMNLASLAHKATKDDIEALASLRNQNIVSNGMEGLRELTYLDESQVSGVHRILTTEMAIVQGPPGTGKTFTSVEAIKVMVANRRANRGPPIIVAAQTNHALDQILAHCIKAGAINVLRIGGRTQNEVVKECRLHDLRQISRIPAEARCRHVNIQRNANIKKIEDLVATIFRDGLLDPDVLLEHKIITKDQRESLDDDEMETCLQDDRGPFALWLGNSLIPGKIVQHGHQTQLISEVEAMDNLPEFECEDDELENIADEEEDQFRIRGTVIKLGHVWSARTPADLSSTTRAVKRALATNSNLFTIDPKLRGAVYRYFQAKLLEAVAPTFRDLIANNIELCRERKAHKFLGNTQLVEQRNIDIVGCTTTGLSKYRGCLAAMKPVSLLIEEAAETREANIVSALYPSVQQLILVGDHKQLAPQCDIRALGEAPYNLNVSLFQRMVNLRMKFVMLNQQRRMKPALRTILEPFYPDLTDHPLVQDINNRPDILGMGGRNCWLFHHNWPEATTADFSKFNEEEAKMVCHFFAYLVRNCTPAERITVLTFYKGQRKVLLRNLKRHPSLMGSTFNVCTVDSFQGEENDVILLSLVRSPPYGSRSHAVGFLDDARRAVVAISRARRGFYVFGNVGNLWQGCPDPWGHIFTGFDAQGCLDPERGIPIVCQNHNRELWIREVEDWGDNAGGCDRDCDTTRPCGHPCALKCHAYLHENLPCSEPCRKQLRCGHGCQKLCSQSCYCDCAKFKETEHQGQAIHRWPMTLEEKLMEMGAEPTEMLLASSRQREETRNQTRSARTPPGLTVNVDQAGSIWAQYFADVDKKQKLKAERSPEKKPSAMIITDVYQPTNLVDGRRVDGEPSRPDVNAAPAPNDATRTSQPDSAAPEAAGPKEDAESEWLIEL
ncbi:hypothetical protein VTK26DRAFT_5257 [Humicola hyalothermophila]